MGGAGNDVLFSNGNSLMEGGAGNDAYTVRATTDVVVEGKNQGIDEVSTTLSVYQLGDNLESLVLTTGAATHGIGNALDNRIIGVDGDQRLEGLDGDDHLLGQGGNDTLEGGAGDDILEGGTGDDVMSGGTGDDLYIVESSADQITEDGTKDGGKDTVQSSVTYTLSDFVETLILTGDDNINGFGSTDNTANTIIGNDGDNRIDGRGGADIMQGGAGNDLYFVDDAGDKIIEAAKDGGIDSVQSSLKDYTLAANVENLGLSVDGENATGNNLDNGMTGNNTDNHLDGGAGDDTLKGLQGNDRLDGGAGDDTLDGGSSNDVDTLNGGAGNDTYIVSDSGDVVFEGKNQGTDTVITTVDGYTLGDNVENLTGSGSAALHLNGNGLNNVITGGAGDDTIDGGSGNDVLSGGNGFDTLIGGAGNDTYIIPSSGGDKITEGLDGGIDTVISANQVTKLAGNVENLILDGTGFNNSSGEGNDIANTITGDDKNNTLTGDGGDDTLIGGGGNDTYVLSADVGKDKIVE
jgi:Ca2+-binding RTX toxin-like protein